MKSENGCPFCREKVIVVIESNSPNLVGKQVQCDNCGARGPIYEDERQAIDSWELGLSNLGERLRIDL